MVYALHEYLNEFFETQATNGLTKSVYHDLNQPFLVGEAKAVAVLSKTIMKPYWAMLEDKSVDYVEMGEHFRKMLAFLEDAAQEPEMLLDGRSSFPEKYVRKDAWWWAVFKSHEVYDPIALTSLGIVVPSLILLFRTHLKEFLSGGEMATISS